LRSSTSSFYNYLAKYDMSYAVFHNNFSCSSVIGFSFIIISLTSSDYDDLDNNGLSLVWENIYRFVSAFSSRLFYLLNSYVFSLTNHFEASFLIALALHDTNVDFDFVLLCFICIIYFASSSYFFFSLKTSKSFRYFLNYFYLFNNRFTLS